MAERQVTFDIDGVRMYGMIHLPDSARAGLVFCHPFAEERKSAYRAMVSAARAFVDAGIAVLRFDYRGCGESEGEFEDATVSTRLADIERAMELLKQEAGLDRVGLLGLRLGALFAAQVAEKRGDLPMLVLWEPATNGKSYFMADLRKKLIKEMMTAGKGSVKREEVIESLKDPATIIDFDGYSVSGQMYGELEPIDLLEQLGRHKAPTLIVQISHNAKISKPLERLDEAYRAAGADVQVVPVVEPPVWNRIDLVECPALTGETLKWIEGKVGNGTSGRV